MSKRKRTTCSVPGCNKPRRAQTGGNRTALCVEHLKAYMEQMKADREAAAELERRKGMRRYSVAQVWTFWQDDGAKSPSPVYWGDQQVWGIWHEGGYKLFIRETMQWIAVASTAPLYTAPESIFARDAIPAIISVSS